MLYTYIKFETQTMGEKARRLLLSKGINSSLRRNPNPNRKEGCNFALYVNGDVYAAFDILTKNNIRNLGVESFRELL
ncbi:MAG: hypothetical protein E7538_00420 [Ruminococcaceae bacterium]|nr:hypothetical protein [Oscillospiraceae bacterium]